MNNSRESSRTGNTPADKNGHEYDYTAYMRVVTNHTAANFIMVRLDHVRHLEGDCDAAVVLSFLLNLLRMKDGNAKDRKYLLKNDLWFRCPAGNIQTQLGIGERRQRTSLQTLNEAGLVDTDRREGNVLWVRINAAGLEEIKDPDDEERGQKRRSAETTDRRNRNDGSQEQKRRIAGTHITKKDREERKDTDCPPHKAGDEVSTSKGFFQVPGSKVSPFDLECATILYNRIGEANKLVRDNSSAAKWAHAFKKLRLGLDDDRPRINKVLTWYVAHMGEPFVPEAFCADSFREKFVKIEARMEPSAADKAKRAEAEEKDRKRKIMDW